MGDPLTTALAWYQDASLPTRWLLRLRPRICDFDPVLTRVPGGSSVLDLGCGRGLLVALLLAAGRAGRVAGVEVSEAALEPARRMLQRAAAAGVTVPVALTVAANPTAWPAGPFDVVVMVDVLHHVPPTARDDFLAAAAARVRPGGRLIYKDMCCRPWWRRWGNALHDLLMTRTRIVHQPVADVEKRLHGEGLEVVERQDWAQLFYGHELRVCVRPG